MSYRARTHGEHSLTVRASGDTTTIDFFGEIGPWGISAKNFSQLLGDVNTSLITLNINSPGGDVFDGIAIYNALLEHSAQVNVRVTGLAASAASLVAMAGDTIAIADNAFFMIHNAWTLAMGDRKAMAETARTLGKIDNELANTYATRTGGDKPDIVDMMDNETWLSASEAMDLGFADSTFGADTKQAKASFDLSSYKHVPKALLAKPKAPARKAPKPQPQHDFSSLVAALSQLESTVSKGL